MNSDLLKARKLELQRQLEDTLKRDEIDNLTNKFHWEPMHTLRKSSFDFLYDEEKKIFLYIDKGCTLYQDDLGEFFDYIDKIKAEYHNFLKDKEQGI